MYYIALRMLFGDKAKYYTMIIGISFAALIMTQQPSILIGLLTRTYAFIEDISTPDIWVMDPGVEFVEEGKPIRDVELIRVRGIKGVEWAVPLFKQLMRAKMPDGSLKSIDLTGIDNATLIGAPINILEGNIEDFRRPDAIFVDVNAANSRLRVKLPDGQTRPLMVGDTLEINDKRAIVVGIVKSRRNFVLQPQVYTTYTNAIKYAPQSRKKLAYILVKAKSGISPIYLAQRIANKTGLKAYEANYFKEINLNYWMKNTGIPINFGTSVLLGFVVGAAVAGQAFYGFVNSNIKHYAVLKAMGVTNNKLIKIVLLQAAIVGFVGYGIGVGVATIFGTAFHDSTLAFKMPPTLLFLSALGVFVIVSAAAAMAIRRITQVDPDHVFRG